MAVATSRVDRAEAIREVSRRAAVVAAAVSPAAVSPAVGRRAAAAARQVDRVAAASRVAGSPGAVERAEAMSPDEKAGSRSTRLGLIGFGFVIGVVVTLVVMFAFKMR